MPPRNQKKKKGRGKVYQKKIEPTLPMKSKEKKKKRKKKEKEDAKDPFGMCV